MTKLRRIAVWLTIAISTLAGSASAQARDDQGPQARLERRVAGMVTPSTQCFAFFQDSVRAQFHWPGDVNCRPVLLVTWFPSKAGMTDELLVDSTGQVSLNRKVCDRPPVSRLVHRLEPGELLNLTTRLASLDQSYRTPKLARLVLVSFSDRGVWRTYAFDSERLPASYCFALDTLRLPIRPSTRPTSACSGARAARVRLSPLAPSRAPADA